MRYILMVLLLGMFAVTNMACEADGKVGDDGAKLKVDVDD